MRFFLLLMGVTALAGCADLHSPPRFSVGAPPGDEQKTELWEYPVGADLTANPGEPKGDSFYPGGIRAKTPQTTLFGQWVDPFFETYSKAGTYYGATKHHGWRIEVERGASPKVLRGLHATDPYDADLGHNFEGRARIMPRFRQKTYSWGAAVSFLAQYQNDIGDDAPNNGMLVYEVHGVTRDQRYTVAAFFGITHPGLKEFGPGLASYDEPDAAAMDAPIRRDPSYLLVENCRDGDFQPSITKIDEFLDTLKPGVAPTRKNSASR